MEDDTHLAGLAQEVSRQVRATSLAQQLCTVRGNHHHIVIATISALFYVNINKLNSYPAASSYGVVDVEAVGIGVGIVGGGELSTLSTR